MKDCPIPVDLTQGIEINALDPIATRPRCLHSVPCNLSHWPRHKQLKKLKKEKIRIVSAKDQNKMGVKDLENFYFTIS